MATGHINPGYTNVVTRFKSALANPSGARRRIDLNLSELNEIRSRAKSAWSIKDESETTYGHYFKDPVIKDPMPVRPSSPTRLNNPHPSNTFLHTHLKDLPGRFCPDLDSSDEQTNSRLYRSKSSLSSWPKTASYLTQNTQQPRESYPSVSVYPSASVMNFFMMKNIFLNIKYLFLLIKF
jgi:hypothetical protein